MVPDTPDQPSRRKFLGDALALGAGSLVLPSAVAHASSTSRAASAAHADASTASSDASDVAPFAPELPARVYVDLDGSARLIEASHQGGRLAI
jgi:hypothetical protein